MPNIIETTIEITLPKSEQLALKPCPFCGNTKIVYEHYLHKAGARYLVCCTNCLACIDPGYAQEPGTVQRMWNRRV